MSNTKKNEAEYNWMAYALVMGAGAASAAFNINGAFLTYSGWLGYAFAFGVGCLEGIALIALHIVITDFKNQHRVKASIAFAVFALATAGCAMSGKRGFKAMNLDAQMQITSELARADRIEAEAKIYFADALAATDMNARDLANNRGNKKQGQADSIRATQAKRTPLSEAMVWIFLILFEGIKAFGIWSIATKTSYRMTKKQIEERAATTARNKASKAQKQDEAALASIKGRIEADLKVSRPNFAKTA